MRSDTPIYFIVFALVMFFLLFGSIVGFSLGKDKGYDQALADIKAITPAPKTTDQQCVAWLFESNLREAKKKICK